MPGSRLRGTLRPPRGAKHRRYAQNMDRWVNAVVEVKVPLDVPFDADREVKNAALATIMDRVMAAAESSWVASGHCELVEDAEQPGRQCSVRNACRSRQRRRHASFAPLSWYSAPPKITAPAT